jgi:hypothetical protein
MQVDDIHVCIIKSTVYSPYLMCMLTVVIGCPVMMSDRDRRNSSSLGLRAESRHAEPPAGFINGS